MKLIGQRTEDGIFLGFQRPLERNSPRGELGNGIVTEHYY